MQVDTVVIESDDVPNAIAGEIDKSGIIKLVIGAPSPSMFTRYISATCCYTNAFTIVSPWSWFRFSYL